MKACQHVSYWIYLLFLASFTALCRVTPVKAKAYLKIKDGKLQRAFGYREWGYVGTPATPGYACIVCHQDDAADDENNGE